MECLSTMTIRDGDNEVPRAPSPRVPGPLVFVDFVCVSDKQRHMLTRTNIHTHDQLRSEIHAGWFVRVFAKGI